MHHLRFPYDLLPAPEKLHLDDAYVLEAPQHCSKPDRLTVVDIKEKLSYNQNVNLHIYRAALVAASTGDIRHDVVCKEAYQRHQYRLLKEEAEVYLKLDQQDICGHSVPMFFGFYTGQTGDGLTGLLLLEYGGDTLSVPLVRQPSDFRRRVITTLITIHRAGVVHNEFEERHIVVRVLDDGSHWPMLVDFSRAKEHICPFEGKLKLYSPKPADRHDYCNELWVVINYAEIRVPSHVDYFGFQVPIRDVEDILKAGTSDARALEEARVTTTGSPALACKQKGMGLSAGANTIAACSTVHVRLLCACFYRSCQMLESCI
ncbi:hypothetical protein C8Q74DRAFT_1234136 [Fomes fomentarius]|nr:hypothetical protein C8Q74DRAFT_1234136 [Fomes fomentarius]